MPAGDIVGGGLFRLQPSLWTGRMSKALPPRRGSLADFVSDARVPNRRRRTRFSVPCGDPYTPSIGAPSSGGDGEICSFASLPRHNRAALGGNSGGCVDRGPWGRIGTSAPPHYAADATHTNGPLKVACDMEVPASKRDHDSPPATQQQAE